MYRTLFGASMLIVLAGCEMAGEAKNMSTGFDFTRTATQTADTYYDKARNSANLALIVKGCDPL